MDTKDSLLTIDSLMKSCDRSAVFSSLCLFLAHNHWLPFFLLFIIHILFFNFYLATRFRFSLFNRKKQFCQKNTDYFYQSNWWITCTTHDHFKLQITFAKISNNSSKNTNKSVALDEISFQFLHSRKEEEKQIKYG